MRTYIIVIMCVLIVSILGQLCCLFKGDYPRKKELGYDVADVLLGGVLVCWGGVILWG